MIRFIRDNRSARLPDEIYSRFVAGDKIADILHNFRIIEESLRWAIELAALRIMAESRPRTRRHQEAREVLVKMGRIEG